MIRAWAVALLGAGCFSPSYPGPGLGCPDGVCPPGQDCVAGVCVLPADAAGQPPDGAPEDDARPGDATPSPDAPPCVEMCVGASDLHICPGAVTVTCAHGCAATPQPHCRVLEPSNDPLADNHLVGASGGLDVPPSQTWRLDTDTGEIFDTTAMLQVRPPGEGVVNGVAFYATPGIGIFAMSGLIVSDGGELDAVGTRALLILSSGDVRIHGRINVRSDGDCPGGGTDRICAGPGGGVGGLGLMPAEGCAPGEQGAASTTTGETGGGGGGFGDNGGDSGGATGVSGASGGSPGSSCTGASLVPLSGGSGGGAALVNPNNGAVGGSGGGAGGAVQVSSYTSILIEQLSTGDPVGVWAGGQGGGGGETGSGGGGGGSGGAILLEAPVVTLVACPVCWLAANGGGGGGGGGSNGGGVMGSPGAIGRFDATPAGGGGGGASAGDGGASVIEAQSAASVIDGTGGGGGGVGKIRINSDTPGVPPASCSPAASTGLPAYH